MSLGYFLLWRLEFFPLGLITGLCTCSSHCQFSHLFTLPIYERSCSIIKAGYMHTGMYHLHLYLVVSIQQKLEVLTQLLVGYPGTIPFSE